jgi:DNA-directed RNA polymerase subunit RPC12/RpoP
MADILYKCLECGWILEVNDGTKPETCEKCGANTIVSMAQETGQFGCVGK